MPRDAEKVRRRLQEAALRLFGERGYEQVTAADIAAAAQVTQRTFFRHFPDKREVLFGGEEYLVTALGRAVGNASPEWGAWQTLHYALRSVESIFVENRPFARPRQSIIATHPALQERAQTKVRDIVAALTDALRDRGISEQAAALAAQIGMVAMNQAVSTWFSTETDDLGAHIDQAFNDVRDLSSKSCFLSPATSTGRLAIRTP